MGPAKPPGWVCQLSQACFESHEIKHPSARRSPYSTSHYPQLSIGGQRNTQRPPLQLCLIDVHLQSLILRQPGENGDLQDYKIAEGTGCVTVDPGILLKNTLRK